MSLDIQRYMSNVPAANRFLTVDELNSDLAAIAEHHPDIATWKRVGSSQLGEPIHMLSFGKGDRNILLFACPHPNEPIGAMMVHHLAHLLVDDADVRDGLGFTWNMIACVDPDGTRLNEGWFNGPFTVSNYARHFYRPAGDNQVEWTFPHDYKNNYYDRTLPESQMLMRVIDDLKPELMGSLHNAGFGGVYYYISEEIPELWDTFHKLPEWEELPLKLGEPEVPYAKEFAPAIFEMLGTSATYDYLEANGSDMSTFNSGGSSDEYASRYGTITLVTEMAYFDDPRVNDQTVTDINRREAILAGMDKADATADLVAEILAAVKDDVRTKSSFEVAVTWFNKMHEQYKGAERHWAKTDPATDRLATVAEVFSSNQESRFYRMLSLGMLVRMLEGEVSVGNGTPTIRKNLVKARDLFDTWSSELESELEMRVVPIRKLVAVQLGAILATAEHLSSNPRV